MPNMNSHIAKHNIKILQQNLHQNLNFSNKELEKRGAPFCNCQNKANCPMPGKCKNSNTVYRYSVRQTDTGQTETYTGCTVGFKVRHGTHMRQVENDNYGSTTLSSHIKSLRGSSKPHNITWNAVERAPPFNPSTGWCRLCTLERYYILFEPGEASLNQRSEFFCHCFHKERKLLVHTKT